MKPYALIVPKVSVKDLPEGPDGRMKVTSFFQLECCNSSIRWGWCPYDLSCHGCLYDPKNFQTFKKTALKYWCKE